MRIGIDLGGTKIEGIVLDDDGDRAYAPARSDAAGHLRGSGRGRSPAWSRELEKRVGTRCTIGVGHPGADLARHRADQERQFDAPERPPARPRPATRAWPRGRAPVERRQLLRRLGSSRRRGRGLEGRVRRDPGHRRGRWRRDRRQAAQWRAGDRRRMGPQSRCRARATTSGPAYAAIAAAWAASKPG